MWAGPLSFVDGGAAKKTEWRAPPGRVRVRN